MRKGGSVFSARQTIGLPGAELVVTVTEEQLYRAGQEPNREWPANEIMYPMGNPTDVVREHQTEAWLGNRRASRTPHNGPEFGWRAPGGRDGIPSSGWQLRLGASPGQQDFQVWELPRRKASVGKDCHEWRLGVRLGASASGEWPQRTSELPLALPGIRKAAFREVADVLRY